MPYFKVNSFDHVKSNIPYIIGIDRNINEVTDKILSKD
jgi:hypothetical protein